MIGLYYITPLNWLGEIKTGKVISNPEPNFYLLSEGNINKLVEISELKDYMFFETEHEQAKFLNQYPNIFDITKFVIQSLFEYQVPVEPEYQSSNNLRHTMKC